MKQVKSLLVTVMLASSSLALGQGADKSKLTMQEAETFPHAGVVVSLPDGFEHSPGQHVTHVFQAGLTSGDDLLQLINLSAHVVRKPTSNDARYKHFPSLSGSGEQLALMFMARRKMPQIKNLKVRSEVKLPIAGKKADARITSFTQGKIETYVAEVCFLRELVAGELNICYVLSVESVAAQKASLLDVFGEIIRNLKLTDLAGPLEMTQSKKDSILVSQGLASSIQIPHGWYATENGSVITFGQVDYKAGQLEVINGSLRVGVLPGNVITAKNYVDDSLKQQFKDNETVKIVEDVPTKWGDKDGHQLIIKQITKPPADSPETASDSVVVVVYRVAASGNEGGGTEINILQLVFRADVDLTKAKAMTDRLANGFKRIPLPKEPIEESGTTPEP